MPTSYRLFFVALAGLVLAAAQQPKEHAQTGQRAQQEQGAPAPTASPSPPAEAPYRPYPNYSPDPCYSAQNHDAADLCAQWRAAIAAEKAAQEAGRATSWGIFATFLSLATVLGLIYSLWQTSGALNEARRGNLIAAKGAARSTRRAVASAKETEAALKIARRNAKAAKLNADATERAIAETQRIGEAQVRCYLTTTQARLGFVSGGKVIIECTIKNNGQSPAREVRCSGRICIFHENVLLYSEPDDGHASFEIDVPAGGEEVATFNVTMECPPLGKINATSVLSLDLELVTQGTDVFGSAVKVEERLGVNFFKPFNPKEWIDLKRKPKVRLHAP